MAADAVGQDRHIVIVGESSCGATRPIPLSFCADDRGHHHIGGGVIGATTAYFLTRHPRYDRRRHRVTLLEASTIAAGASGKAGGLLALWAYPDELVGLSYRLHRELAEEHDGARRWGYRRVGCGSVRATVSHADLKRRAAEVEAIRQDGQTDRQAPDSAPRPHDPPQKPWEKLPKQDEHAAGLLSEPSAQLPPDLDYIDAAVVEHYQQMGQPETAETAQVHPLHFTTTLVSLAEERGVNVRLGAQVLRIVEREAGVETVEYLDRNTQTEVRLDHVTDVIVAAGPWTGVVLPRTKVTGLRAHSVVWQADVAPYAIFTDVALPADYVPEHRVQAGQRRRRHTGRVDPEIYARPFGEVYACGEPDVAVSLPATADLVAVDAIQCADLVAYAGTASSVLAAAPVTVRQACYLPRHIRFGDEHGPLIGRTRTPGLWVASGHTCWGIQNGPATGCLMAELLLDGRASSANIDRLDPRKFKV
ncbi:FAD dependent oxidoreductase superfamily [Grosmannia clavigera kw1407]|uniref:FAD dependent oxidoreductase superfamily n=1 Tax=Grosmannia clavigera (strain kw1407 / UAMH 11150) TaxID=655863 RepID=F0XIK7_GROCL|nr:FAD dependent oxidoreductase superfamily [Grosmannia clavigera kw1407]EFX02480.1 FAD dependent oxidoreductase superfamily [Grosmannia clavigera kw1407]